MKKLILILLATALLIPSILMAEEQAPFLDLNQCQIKVGEIREVDSIQGEGGKKVKPSRRDSKLIEVEFLGTIINGGISGLYPSQFSVLCSYRRSSKIFPSIAVGFKHNNDEGKEEAYWLNKKGASMIVEYDEGGELRFFALFEVPKDESEYFIQYPVHATQ